MNRFQEGVEYLHVVQKETSHPTFLCYVLSEGQFVVQYQYQMLGEMDWRRAVKMESRELISHRRSRPISASSLVLRNDSLKLSTCH